MQLKLMSFNPDKTEIMIFSNRSIPENLDFSFNGKSVRTTTSHKHSDFSFCNDANWEYPFIIFRVVYLNILRRLTYRLSHTNLA
jgi:hypothetical protein